MPDVKEIFVLFGIHMILSSIFQRGLCLHRGEYCIDDAFTASCPDDEILDITNAMYGRMELGKCISIELMMGCKEDVRGILDRRCSGRQQCRFDVIKELRDVQPCPKGTGPYLEVVYDCIKASTLKDYTCTNKQLSLTTTTYHISPKQTDCSSPYWSLQVQPGQRITITLNDFTENRQHHTSCKVLGYIVENVVRTNKTLCTSDIRDKIVYTSVGYHVDVHLIPESDRQAKGVFVMKYDVLGCEDIDVPYYVYYNRESNRVHAGCSEDDISWHTECVEGKWSETIGNCSVASLEGHSGSWSFLQFLQDIPETILLSVVIGVSVFLSIIILVCGVVYISRHRHQESAYSETYSQGPRRSDSEFKLYGGPTMDNRNQTIQRAEERSMYYNERFAERKTPLLDNRTTSNSVHSTPRRILSGNTSSDRLEYNTFEVDPAPHTRAEEARIPLYTGLQNTSTLKGSDIPNDNANITDDNKISEMTEPAIFTTNEEKTNLKASKSEEEIYLEPEQLDGPVHDMQTLQIQ